MAGACACGGDVDSRLMGQVLFVLKGMYDIGTQAIRTSRVKKQSGFRTPNNHGPQATMSY